MEVKQEQMDIIVQLKDVVAKAHEALKGEQMSLRSIKDDVHYLMRQKLELKTELEVIRNSNEDAKKEKERIIEEGRAEAEKIKKMAGEKLREAFIDRENAAKELEAAKNANFTAQKELQRTQRKVA